MTADQSRVERAAIADAMRIIEGLHGHDRHGLKQFIQLVQEALDTWGHSLLTQAFMLLIGVGFDQMKFPEYKPELRFRLAGAATSLIHRAPLQQEVPADVLATLAGGFTAAVTGIDVYRWRTGLGPIPDSETIAWAYACATTVTILDDKLGPGVFGRVVATITGADDNDLSQA
jgi:hypothetical protein